MPRCIAITRAGEQCKRHARNGHTTCFTHDNQEQRPVQQPQEAEQPPQIQIDPVPIPLPVVQPQAQPQRQRQMVQQHLHLQPVPFDQALQQAIDATLANMHPTAPLMSPSFSPIRATRWREETLTMQPPSATEVHLADDDGCPVCLEGGKAHRLTCGHCMHLDCMAWLKKRQCPLCRANISDEWQAYIDQHIMRKRASFRNELNNLRPEMQALYQKLMELSDVPDEVIQTCRQTIKEAFCRLTRNKHETGRRRHRQPQPRRQPQPQAQQPILIDDTRVFNQ